MSAPRRSARIASMSTPTKAPAPRVCPPAPKKEVVPKMASSEQRQALLDELNTITAETVISIRYMSDSLKARASHDELTVEAITWLTRLSWAVEDCYEYKTRQLTANCDETVTNSMPLVFQHFRTLTAEAAAINERLQQQYTIPRFLVFVISTFGASIKDALYII
jgi:hypothetical protein